MAAPQPEDHLAAYAAVQRAADREILAELRNAFRDTTRQLSVLARDGREMERARVLAVRKAILEEQAKFYERMGNVVQRRRVEAAARAIQVSGRYDEAVFRRAGREEDLRALSESLEETEAKAPEALVARLSPGGSRMDLSQRVYRTQAYTKGLLERRINSALTRGLTAQEFAREVRDLINPNTPGGVRFAALRLARSEINNAYHAMAIRAAELKPWVTGMQWHTSDSHSRPDKCDQLNKEIFSPPTETPLKPHPQCMCYVTQVIGDPDKSDEENDDDFLDDLVSGLFDDFLDDHGANNGGASEPDTSFELEDMAGNLPQAPVAEPAALPQHRSGRNMLDEILASVRRHERPGEAFLADSAEGDPYLNVASDFSRPGDILLGFIARQQGYGLPRVGDSDDIDRAVATGHTEAFRGTQNYRTASASQQMDELRESEDFVLGYGIYGNGIYVSEDSRAADQYAGRTPGVKPIGKGKGVAVRMAISPTARFADWNALRPEHEAFLNGLSAEGVNPSIIGLFMDISIYAAALGYDGMYIPDQDDGAYIPGDPGPRRQWAIYNREVLIVERTNR